MATATSYTNSYAGLGSQGDLYHSANYGSYDTGFGSLTSHPYQYQTSKYAPYSSDYRQQSSHYYPPDPYATESAQQPPSEFSNQFTNSKIHGQVSMTNTEQQQHEQNNHQDKSRVPHSHPHGPSDEHVSGQPSKPIRREPSLKSQPLPPIGQRPPSSSGTGKGSNPPAIDLRMNKSTAMRAAAIKHKEEILEQKRRDAYFPSNGKKTTPNKSTKEKTKGKEDGHQSDAGRFKRSKKQSHSVPKQRRSRRMNYLTDGSSSSSDEEQPSRSKSRKAPPTEKYPALPPVRRGRLPPPHPYYDPIYDYPPGHPMRRRYPPYYDDYPPYPYPYPHPYPPYRTGQRGPPYLPPYQDPYDGFFDYEKRKVKSKPKSRGDRGEDHATLTGNETEREDENPTKSNARKKNKSKGKKSSTKDETQTENQWPEKYPPGSNYFDEGEALETWRQERNDYLKKKFKPTIHEVLYSQQWMKADSYLENQRRRALRDSQGYYFPYKQYTLKDYKDLQRAEATKNPYAPLQDPLTERKERSRKPPSNVSQRSGKPLAPLRPIHPDPEKSSKRERALEYAKVQVLRQPAKKDAKDRIDPTEEYVNNLFPHQENGDDDDEHNENHFQGQRRRHHRDQNQSEGDDDDDEDNQ